MNLSCRQIRRVWSAPTARCRGAAGVSAAEGLAFLTMSAVAIAALVVTATRGQRHLETDYWAAADLRCSTRQVQSVAEVSGVPCAASLHREENQTVPGTTVIPVLAGAER